MAPNIGTKEALRLATLAPLFAKPFGLLGAGGAHAVRQCACFGGQRAPTNVTQKGVLRLAKCKASATREGL